MLDFAAWTEGLGFTGAWLPEHHGAEDAYLPSPLTVLAALAVRTKKLRIGTSIALGALYHPTRFAEDCAVIDILSNGRLEMAVAVGYRRKETDAFGVEFTTRGRQLDEFLEIVTRLWAGESVTYQGKIFNVKNALIMPRPVNGHIPLYLGGWTPKALQRAAKYANGYFGNVETYGIYRDALVAAGKDPDKMNFLVQGVFSLVAEDPEKAWAELGPYYLHVNNTYSVWLNEENQSSLLQIDTMPSRMTMEEFKTKGILQIWTPSEAIETFKKMREQSPMEHYMFSVPPGIPLAKFAPYAEVIANKVMPAFR
jgi:alkanesulfonate monooxygenase SsuD/methylene tetrahydromethanopterin reductase-like flavin-dependent oxidoreductase (luciferase family)